VTVFEDALSAEPAGWAAGVAIADERGANVFIGVFIAAHHAPGAAIGDAKKPPTLHASDKLGATLSRFRTIRLNLPVSAKPGKN